MGLSPHHHCLPHRASGSLPQSGGKAGAAALVAFPAWAGLEFMEISALSWEPGLAWLPTPLRRAVSGFGRSSSSHTHGSCTLREILGCRRQQNPAIPSRAFPGYWDGLVPAPASPGQEGKWCQGTGRSRLGLRSWEKFFPALCSLPMLWDGAAAWQDPQCCSPVTATIRDTLPRLWGIPRKPHAGVVHVPSPSSSPLQFQRSPSTGHGTLQGTAGNTQKEKVVASFSSLLREP